MRIFLLLLFVVLFRHANCQAIDTVLIANRLIIDTSHNPDSVFHYIWDANTQKWNPEERNVFSYNALNYKTQQVISNWNIDIWEITDKIDYIFNDNILVQQTNFWWDWPYSEWITKTQYNLKYDSLNRLIENHITKWSFENLVLVNDSLYIFDYDSMGNCSAFTKRIWLNYTNDWENFMQVIYFYDGLSNNTKQIHYLWDIELEIWQPEQINNFVYNVDNLLIEQQQLTMNSFQTEWENKWKREYAYHNNRLIKEEIYFVWGLMDGNFKWIENFNNYYRYDAFENLIAIDQYYFDWDLLIWSNQFQILNTYYDAGLLNTSTYYYWNFGRWNELEKYSYNYPGYVSIKMLANSFDVKVYPNPAKDKVSILFNEGLLEMAQVELYDLKGQKVYSSNEHFSDSFTEINLPNLNNGVYLLKIIGNRKISSTKLIICK